MARCGSQLLLVCARCLTFSLVFQWIYSKIYLLVCSGALHQASPQRNYNCVIY